MKKYLFALLFLSSYALAQDAQEQPLPEFSLTEQKAKDFPNCGTGTNIGIKSIRFGQHQDFVRVVIELSGSVDSICYGTSYVDKAREAGSGEIVPMKGKEFLFIDIAGLYIEDFEKIPAQPSVGKIIAPLTEVHVDAIFEGSQETYIGMNKKYPHRVFKLDNPSRLVVDVAIK